MDTIRVIVEYSASENKLKSVLVDGQPLRDIWPIEEKSVEEWFEVSSGRDGWEGLISEIKKVIADKNVSLNFEFQGPNEYKERFDRCIKERGYNTDGSSKDELIKENLEKAEKAEHRGWHKQAIEYYTNAAELSNDPETQYKIAEYYKKIHDEEIEDTDIDKQKAIQKAITFYELAAGQGHKDAQWMMAQFLCTGDGVMKDVDLALEWMLKYTEQDLMRAYVEIGRTYQCGACCSDFDNEEEAIKWYMKAAEKNYPEAYYWLGMGESNPEEQFKWFLKAAEENEPESQIEVAQCYMIGKGVERNQEEAFSWLMRAAERGHESVCGIIAKCYLIGYGVEKNEDEALKWYMKDYNQDCAQAYFKMGHELMVESERLGPALPWIKMAIEKGNSSYYWYDWALNCIKTKTGKILELDIFDF